MLGALSRVFDQKRANANGGIKTLNVSFESHKLRKYRHLPAEMEEVRSCHLQVEDFHEERSGGVIDRGSVSEEVVQ